MRDAESPFRNLEDPVSADEIRQYVAMGWAAILHETWVPRYASDPWSAEFETWGDSAYESGFVPSNVPGSDLVPWWRLVNRRPDRFRWMGLRAILKWNHVMWRGHSVGGGGFVDVALRLGALQAMLRRLTAIAAADESSTARNENSLPAPKADAYGGILFDGDGRVLLIEPSGHFGGYTWTFAKGRPGKGESPEQAALRRVLEKTGYQAEIFDVLPLAYEGDTSTTAYFLMASVGDQARFTAETAQTRWVSVPEAADLIARTTSAKGRDRDLAVLAAAQLATIDPIPYPPIQNPGRSAKRPAHLTNSTGLVIPENPEISLQVLDTVDGIVRRFVVDGLALRGDYIEQKITHEEAVQRMGVLSTSMQAIFYGKNPNYEATDWNTPERLGKWLTENAKAVPPPVEDAVARLFNLMLMEIGGTLNAIDAGTLDPSYSCTVIDDAIARNTAHLLGWPPEMLAGTSS